MSVLVVRVYSFDCDEPGCDAFSGDEIPNGDEPNKLRWARRETAKRGWAYRDGKDYCPLHGGKP